MIWKIRTVFEELLMCNVYTQEALINLLEAKGTITKTELLEGIKKLKKTGPKQGKG